MQSAGNGIPYLPSTPTRLAQCGKSPVIMLHAFISQVLPRQDNTLVRRRHRHIVAPSALADDARIARASNPRFSHLQKPLPFIVNATPSPPHLVQAIFMGTSHLNDLHSRASRTRIHGTAHSADPCLCSAIRVVIQILETPHLSLLAAMPIKHNITSLCGTQQTTQARTNSSWCASRTSDESTAEKV